MPHASFSARCFVFMPHESSGMPENLASPSAASSTPMTARTSVAAVGAFVKSSRPLDIDAIVAVEPRAVNEVGGTPDALRLVSAAVQVSSGKSMRKESSATAAASHSYVKWPELVVVLIHSLYGFCAP